MRARFVVAAIFSVTLFIACAGNNSAPNITPRAQVFITYKNDNGWPVKIYLVASGGSNLGRLDQLEIGEAGSKAVDMTRLGNNDFYFLLVLTNNEKFLLGPVHAYNLAGKVIRLNIEPLLSTSYFMIN